MTQLAYTSSRLLEALLILLPGFKFILSWRIESPKKQSCRATAATRKTHMHPNWNRVWSSTSQGFDLNAIKFRTTTYIKIDYITRQARTRCWREAGPLGFMHRRTGLYRRAALRLAHRVRLGSVFGAIAAARELMGVGQLAETLARVLTSISRCICARVPETNAYDRVLAHTRRLRNRALGSPHVALPDSRIVQGCALRVVHVLHPFDPPRHKSSSAHCASSARHALRRTATTRTRLGGGHGVRISTPDLGPALLERRQMEEKGREKTWIAL
ncbi:hypothetical protein B0H14DRAFT_2618310 [Mycena olivaceomarginata]|nr:hypothetical protein B0H14DRAFT_2618310 [Mycena olivaceomarginata]